MKEKPTSLVLRSLPDRTPHSLDELADIYLSESGKIENDRSNLFSSCEDELKSINAHYSQQKERIAECMDNLNKELAEAKSRFEAAIRFCMQTAERNLDELQDRRRMLQVWFERNKQRLVNEPERETSGSAGD